jgi:hypothetical protein
MATMVSTVVVKSDAPELSPESRAATPTRPRALGTSSQKAGVKVTMVGGLVRCLATNAATGVMAAAPTNADRTPPKTTPPRSWAP